jgi:hypothetical protein
MRKGISDLHRRAQVSQAANARYLDYLAAADISETLRGHGLIKKIGKTNRYILTIKRTENCQCCAERFKC